MANQPGLPTNEPQRPPPTGRSAADTARIVGILVAIVVLVAFVVDNSQTVRVGFLFFHANVSLIWALVIAAILGMAVDRLVIFLVARRRARGRTKSGTAKKI